MNHGISLANLILFLDKKYGKNGWIGFEPETIALDLTDEENPSEDLLLLEKIHVVQILARDGVSESLKKPEFVLQACLVANNEPAEFEEIILPNSLQLAWAIKQFQWISIIFGEPLSWPSEFSDLVFYILNLEGFSEPIDPFNFIGKDRLYPGQSQQDTEDKAKGISAYINYMKSKSHV